MHFWLPVFGFCLCVLPAFLTISRYLWYWLSFTFIEVKTELSAFCLLGIAFGSFSNILTVEKVIQHAGYSLVCPLSVSVQNEAQPRNPTTSEHFKKSSLCSTPGVGNFEDGKGHNIFTFAPEGHNAYNPIPVKLGRCVKLGWNNNNNAVHCNLAVLEYDEV